MPSILSSLGNSLLNLAFPQVCHSCSRSVKDSRLGVACSDCWNATRLFDDFRSACPKCGSVGDSAATAFHCRNCESHQYDATRSMGVYEQALRANVLHLKRVPVIPRILIERMRTIVVDTSFANTDLIIPVPLSQKRYVERGFNQAEVLATAVSRHTGISLDAQSLVRKKHTRMHRAGMDRKAREATVQNAFEVVRPKLVEGRSILLVDDIFTSGATVSNCAKVLKRKGVVRVNVFTLARTIDLSHTDHVQL